MWTKPDFCRQDSRLLIQVDFEQLQKKKERPLCLIECLSSILSQACVHTTYYVVAVAVKEKKSMWQSKFGLNCAFWIPATIDRHCCVQCSRAANVPVVVISQKNVQALTCLWIMWVIKWTVHNGLVSSTIAHVPAPFTFIYIRVSFKKVTLIKTLQFLR